MKKIYIHPEHMSDNQVQLDKCMSLEEAMAYAPNSETKNYAYYFCAELCEAYNAVTGEFLWYAVARPQDYDKLFSKPARK